ncbi:PcfJ domain-containing protein [Halomonas sp. Bachu 37]|uniref:PcfJ domain-containing protein n=1 Tax=Halomonas kashgarensis TaxID=3084920 RepID=UPI0032164446
MSLKVLLRRFILPWRKAPAPPKDRVTFDLEPMLGYSLRLNLALWRSSAPFSWESYVGREQVAKGSFLEPPGIGWDMLLTIDPLMLGIPDDVRSVIDTAPFLGVELAQVCGQLEAARELAVSSPLLLILLVNCGAAAGWSQEAFVQRLAQKQATLCATVGLPGGKSSAKLLRRCALRPMIRRELLEIKRILSRHEDGGLLRHHASVHLEHLVFLARYEGPRWPGLLGLVDATIESQRPSPGHAAWLQRLLTDVERMMAGHTQALRRVTSTEELQELHDRLVQQLNAQVTLNGRAKSSTALRQQHGSYPAPPLPGHEAIVPIASWEALLQEGQRMQHCVGAYHNTVAAGQVAIYHLSSPDAVTIAIRPQGSGWVLSEARGKCNAMPSAEALQLIQTWLSRSAEKCGCNQRRG